MPQHDPAHAPAGPGARVPALRMVAMPKDTNPSGDIFGGWLMSLMDIGAGQAAAQVARGRVVTVAMDGMQFHQPVKVGDEISVYCEVVRVGRTSVAVSTEAWCCRRLDEDPIKVTEALFTFVALDNNGRPRPVGEE